MIAPNPLYSEYLPQDAPEYALAYAKLGLSILPVHGMVHGICTCGENCGRNAGKHPIAQLTRRGAKDAAIRQETVSRWWRTWPAANVAMACGSVSGIVVVDADGEAGVAELERRGYPVSWTALSGAGGLHVYLEHPGHRVGNWKISGVGDLRADGGYVVAPPSRHRSGGRYEWLPGCSPWEVGLASAPEWVPLKEPQETPRVSPPARMGPPPSLSRLSRRMQDLIRYGNSGQYQSRSEADMAACVAMLGAGYGVGEVWAVMTEPRNGISEKFFEKGSQGERYLQLTISKARAFVKPSRRARIYPGSPRSNPAVRRKVVIRVG